MKRATGRSPRKTGNSKLCYQIVLERKTKTRKTKTPTGRTKGLSSSRFHSLFCSRFWDCYQVSYSSSLISVYFDILSQDYTAIFVIVIKIFQSVANQVWPSESCCNILGRCIFKSTLSYTYLLIDWENQIQSWRRINVLLLKPDDYT